MDVALGILLSFVDARLNLFVLLIVVVLKYCVNKMLLSRIFNQKMLHSCTLLLNRRATGSST